MNKSRRLPVVAPAAPHPSPLPPLYASWIDELLGVPLPDETGATCGDCAMWPEAGSESCADEVTFDRSTRCCTYLPTLPNFLVGRALGDATPEAEPGRASLRARIAAGTAVTPLGLASPAAVLDRYLDAKRTDSFGRNPELRCPHYVDSPDGGCGLWRHRNATCATWFCKHGRGGVGMMFWSRLGDLLSTVETRLARWCVLSLDPGEAALAAIFPASSSSGWRGAVTPPADDAPASEMWGRWAGREEAFYVACAELVAPLSWSEIVRIAGSDVLVSTRLLQDAHAALGSDDLPATSLRAADPTARPLADGRVRLVGYSSYDPLDVPPALMRVIERFDGRPTDDVLASLRAEGLEVQPALVRRLLDFEVLRKA